MKSLSLSKPLIIVTVGAPGAGKSFFARQFSQTFGAPVVNYDRLRYELFAEPTYSKDERTIIQRVAEYQVEELIKTQKTFIVDGGGTSKAERLQLKKIAEKSGYGLLIVWVQVDARAAKVRSLKRSKRRTDDAYNQSLSSEQFEKAVKRFTPPTFGEEYIVVSGKHTHTSQAKAVLKKLVTPREEINPHETNQPIAPERPDKKSPRRSVKIS